MKKRNVEIEAQAEDRCLAGSIDSLEIATGLTRGSADNSAMMFSAGRYAYEAGRNLLEGKGEVATVMTDSDAASLSERMPTDLSSCAASANSCVPYSRRIVCCRMHRCVRQRGSDRCGCFGRWSCTSVELGRIARIVRIARIASEAWLTMHTCTQMDTERRAPLRLKSTLCW